MRGCALVVPAYLAATAGSQALAGQVNQFLVSHSATYVQAGTRQAAQTTSGSGFASSVNQWIAQSFTTTSSQTTTGYVVVTASVGGSPSPWVFSIQASSSGTPSGAPLASTPLPAEFVPASAGPVTVILPVSGLSPSVTYWLVAEATGAGTDFFEWSTSNQVSGAATSPDGSSWTPHSFGMLYQVWDASLVPPLTGIWEDSGARWTSFGYTGSLLTSVKEFTTGQTPAGYTESARALTYSGGLLTGIA